MTKSRRQLSFVQISEYTSNRDDECALRHAPHTSLSALMSWRIVAAQKLALTELHLTQQCLICRPHDIGRMVKNPDIKPRWEKDERRANCCIPMCSNTSFTLSKIASSEQIYIYHTYFNVKMCNIQHHYANGTTTLFMKHYSPNIPTVAPVTHL